MRLAVLGSGLMGSALGRRWAAQGHAITFSYARDPRRLEALAHAAGGAAQAAPPAEAVRESDAVLLAVPWHRLEDVLAQAGPLDGRVVISCSLPMTPDDSALAIGLTTSGAEALALRTGARVVSAFNTVPSELITALADEGPGSVGETPAVAYCGDDEGAKRTAEPLLRDAGFEPVDAGPLRIARYLEPFGLLVAQLAYVQGLGPALGYRWLARRAETAMSAAATR
jgi:predicted dinucleotide-binding enzyme